MIGEEPSGFLCIKLHPCLADAEGSRIVEHLGHKVFCSDMTFDATVNPVAYEDGEAVFIDTERDTWNMDPVALEKAFEIYPEVKLVVLVHLCGTPAKLDEIMAVCEKHGAVLAEDAAESFGATYKGKQTGTFGSGNIISFHGNNLLFPKGEKVAKIA